MSMKHILIVDDDIMASHVLQEHLEKAGHLVTVAETCHEAEEALREPVAIDLVILDYLMPDGHGTDVIRAMAEDSSLQKPRIIMCSSLIDPTSPAWKALCDRIPFGLQSLIRAYVAKPYTFEDMDPAINALLAEGNAEILSGDYLSPAEESKPVSDPASSL